MFYHNFFLSLYISVVLVLIVCFSRINAFINRTATVFTISHCAYIWAHVLHLFGCFRCLMYACCTIVTGDPGEIDSYLNFIAFLQCFNKLGSADLYKQSVVSEMVCNVSGGTLLNLTQPQTTA